jgi:methylthioribose-1-phosphate isomerase
MGGIDGHLRLLDQTRLPRAVFEIDCHNIEQVWEAIRSLRVRGAPAIGVAAAYGICLVGKAALGVSPAAFVSAIEAGCDYLATSRPTAVNLFWALQRMRVLAETAADAAHAEEIAVSLLREAKKIQDEDAETCANIGRIGAELLRDGDGVLTHCNAGALATCGDGTALAVIFAAHRAGKRLRVFADETRPLLQGARLTAWELVQYGVPCTILCDGAAAHAMKEGLVQAVITGADRIAANGDAANKIGTYSVALAAAAHGIPFYVAAPQSTFDLSLSGGESIPIEQRPPGEVTGVSWPAPPPELEVFNPAFDVTPARLIRAIICERGLIEPVTAERIASIFATAPGK